MTSMLYTVLSVGQGTGTLIEVIDDSVQQKPLTMILVDLGSQGWFKDATGVVSADHVIGRLKAMASGPTIDALFISHSDEDHINMIPVVLAGFKKPGGNAPRKETLVINKVWIGGPTKSYGAFLRTLADFTPGGAADIHSFGVDVSDLAKPLYSKNDVDIYVMIANTVASNTKVATGSSRHLGTGESYLINTDSLVLLVSYGTSTKRHIVAPGDATALTMAACVERLSAFKWNKAVLSIALPHHGSATTTYNVLGAVAGKKDTNEVAQEVVNNFVDFLKPESVTVSAGEVKMYKHPSPRVIKDFAKHAKDAAEAKDKGSPVIYVDPALKTTDHFYTAYFKTHTLQVTDAMDDDQDQNATTWPRRKGWWTARMSKAVYTTDYFTQYMNLPAATTDIPRAFPPVAEFASPPAPYIPAPPWGWAWEYSISQDGTKVSFTPQYSWDTASIELVQFVERQEPLPQERFTPASPAPLAKPATGPTSVDVGITTQSRAARTPRPGRRLVRPLP